MSRNVCCMQSCRNTKHEFPNLSFHNFPTKETQRCQKWVQFCDNQSIWRLFETNDPKLEHKSICSQHFHDNSYNNPMKKIRLMCNALPTIKANTKKKSTVTDTTAIKPPEPIVVSAQLLLRTNLSRNCRTNRPQNSSSLSTTTDNRENTSNVTKSNDENVMSLDNQIVSTRKTNPITNHFSTQHTKYETEIKSLKDKLKKCKKQVMNLRYRLKRTEAIGNSQKSKLNYILKNIKSLNEEELNPVLSEIIQSNLSNAFIAKSRSQKWSNSMKKFCSDIYHKSPSAYRHKFRTN
ncbi:THAP domain-containing protein 1-like [Oppia nitens]|uniref:THAP domain-containing protein 1-like n=1 Tax=Oppia nitens TaxID=1686743 RepID=UPI0023DC2428|nr:THAP domain-containing protein 1-like [Oppia nitens]